MLSSLEAICVPSPRVHDEEVGRRIVAWSGLIIVSTLTHHVRITTHFATCVTVVGLYPIQAYLLRSKRVWRCRAQLQQQYIVTLKGGSDMPARKPEECDMLLIEAVHKGDLEAAIALYEPNASYVLDSGQVITGRAAIREVFQGYLTLKPKFTMEVSVARSGGGNLALTGSTWSVTGIEAGKPFTMSGKSVEVVRRQRDGTWLFVIDNPHGAE